MWSTREAPDLISAGQDDRGTSLSGEVGLSEGESPLGMPDRGVVYDPKAWEL